MSTGDIPQISGSTYTTSSVNLGNIYGAADNTFVSSQQMIDTEMDDLIRNAKRRVQHPQWVQEAVQQQPKGKEKMASPTNRVVQVFIADVDENLPLEKRLLYKGDVKFTDMTNQELFFEIDIKSLLDAHNTYRVTVQNKKVKERVEMLDPVKIRDLKMVVVDVAGF